MATLKVTVVRGQVSGPAVRSLPPGSSVTLGRSVSADVSIQGKGISRLHCRIDFSKEEETDPRPRGRRRGTPEPEIAAPMLAGRLTDLGSCNGTTVNNEPAVGAVLLTEGDVIRFGDAKISVTYERSPAPRDLSETDRFETLNVDRLVCERCSLRFGGDPQSFAGSVAHGRFYLCGECSQAVRTGKRIGDFPIVSELGRGGFACVYKALLPPHLQDMIALKHFEFPTVVNPDDVALLHREIRNLGMFRHPNIVRVITTAPVVGGYLIAMELIRGEDLYGLVRREAPLPPGKAIAIAVSILRGLEFMHARGVLHRDIKPQNVLMEDTGRVVLADLGLAKRVADATQITKSDEGKGTPRFMPPEQYINAADVDQRADVYSAGATLFHMLTGEPPFAEAKSFMQLYRKVTSEEPKRIEDIQPGLSAALGDVLEFALKREREERTPTVAALRAALEGLGSL
jgi:hypothetical protein